MKAMRNSLVRAARRAAVPVVLAGLVAGFGMGIAAPALAQTADATLGGVVHDAGKQPIAGATVTATSESGKVSQKATTGANGEYVLILPPGTYSVTATAPGFWAPTRQIDLVAGRQDQIEFSMTPMLTEVVSVTASKQGETKRIDVPYSVEAHSEEDLRDRGAQNIEDIAANVGGFTVQSLGPGQSQVAMRGVSSGQIARDQPGVKEQVGVYLDESAVSMSLFTPDFDLVDLNRVEVLRGPQGTLYGSGSEAGTVRYVTNQPLLKVNEGFVDFGAATADEGGEAGDVKAGVNIPLGDKMAARVVGYYSHLSGATDALQPDFSVDQNVNDGFRTGTRIALTMQPTDKLTITPRFVYQRAKSYGWNLQDEYNILANPFTTSRPAVDLDNREEFTQLGESFQDNVLMADVNVRYEFGDGLALTSITSYMDREIRVVRDTTALTASFTGGTLGLPEPIYTLDSPLFDNTDGTIWTQELRLTGGKDKLTWLGGLFYTNSTRRYGQDVTVPGLNAATGGGLAAPGVIAPVDTLYFARFDYDLDQFAVFGEATMKFTDKFSLTGGLRWYDYKEDKGQIVDGMFSGNPNFGTGVLEIPGSTEASGFAPRVIGTFKVSDSSVFNAQVSKGFRLGGINDPLNVPLCSPQDLITFGGHDSWDDETVWNYEVGYKWQGMAGRSLLYTALFYEDISDLQTTVTAGTCSSRVVFNVPNARSRGVELEYDVAPTKSLDIAFSGIYNDAEIRSTLTSTDALGNVSVVSGIESGRRLPTVPELQGSVAATYRWNVGKSSQMYTTGVYQYVGSRFTQVGDEDLGTVDMTAIQNQGPPGAATIGGPLTQSTFTYDPKLPAYSLLNLRLGLRHGQWDIAAYVNNATNELAFLALDRERGTLARVGYLTNQPRTAGITTRFTF
jgi:iron complex outermembrane receptor protein